MDPKIYSIHYPDIVPIFSSNHNVHKSSSGLCFWAPDPLIDSFYKNLWIKGSGAKKQRLHTRTFMNIVILRKSLPMQYTYTLFVFKDNSQNLLEACFLFPEKTL